MLSTIFSAILLILTFPKSNFNYVAFIAFVPLFFAIYNKSPKRAFFLSYLCGFLFYLGVLYWLGNVTVIGLIILCLYLALYFGILGFIFVLITHHTSRITIFSIPFIWVLLEYIQTHLFTGFGWVLLGYSQYKNLPFIQIADFSGVYGVSFVLMMVNVIVFSGFRVQGAGKIFWLLVILLLVYGYGFFRLNEKNVSESSVKISVIQGNIPQDIKWDPLSRDFILNQYRTLTKMASLDDPDLIVWPETSFPGFFIIDRDETNRVLDLVKEIKKPLLLGANTEKARNYFNSAMLISGEGEVLDKYDKIHLVPFGEYVPFSDKVPFLHNLVLGELGEFTHGKEFDVFRVQGSRDRGQGKREFQFATVICYEDIFPEIAKRFVQKGAQFLIVITNDAWYGDSGAPYQHTACSVFRAIENRVSVIRCANTGYSCFIDRYGRIYGTVEKDGKHLFITGYKTSEVMLPSLAQSLI